MRIALFGLLVTAIQSLGAQVLLDSIPFGNTIYDVDISKDGSQLFIAGKDSTIKIWNNSNNELSSFEGHTSSVSSLNYNEKSKTILSGSYDNSAILWDISGREIVRLEGHTKGVINVAQNDDFLVTVSRDNTIKMWDRKGKLIRTLTGHTAQVNDIAFIEQMAQIVTVSFDKTVKFWSYTGDLLKSFDTTGSGLRAVAVSVENNLVVSGDRSGKIFLNDLDGGKMKVIEAHGLYNEEYRMIGNISFTRNSTFTTSGGDGYIRVWSLDGVLLSETKAAHGKNAYVSGLGVTNEILVSGQGGPDESVKVWDLTSVISDRYSCENQNYNFLKRILGEWTVATKDRTSPGIYEDNKGQARITPSISGCGISISYAGRYNGKPYARSVGIVGQDSTFVQMVTLDSEHSSYSTLDGTIENGQLVVTWFRDKEKKRVQSRYIMSIIDEDAFEFSSYLSTDYGENWALTHERKYTRK
ncbi:MAG: WD40 repeat domain-containing protein [Cyclobacteriaceae bacterium]